MILLDRLESVLNNYNIDDALELYPLIKDVHDAGATLSRQESIIWQRIKDKIHRDLYRLF